jgi:hypothetical protein
LGAIFEELERAFVEIEQHAHTISIFAAWLLFALGLRVHMAMFIVTPEAYTVCAREPYIGAIAIDVEVIRIKVWPAHANIHTETVIVIGGIRQQLNLPIVFASVQW